MLEKYSLRKSVFSYQMADKAVIVFSPRKDKIYTLNPVASFIFGASNGKNKIKDIVALVGEEFNVREELAQKPTLSFIQYMVDNKILFVTDNPPRSVGWLRALDLVVLIVSTILKAVEDIIKKISIYPYRYIKRRILKKLYQRKSKAILSLCIKETELISSVRKNSDVIGVTIGCGENWYNWAKLSAERFSKCTGLPHKIIDQSSFGRIKTREILNKPFKDRAKLIKLYLFDLIQDYENIIYFDSDIVYLKKWDPSPYLFKKELVCVKDRWWMGGVKDEAKRNQLDHFRYFNSGFLIVNRTHHTILFEYARRIRELISSIFQDQTALNRAVKDLGIPLLFLSQKYNCMCDCNSDEENNIIGKCEYTALHNYKPGLSKEQSAIWEEIIANANQPKDFYYNEQKMPALSGKYILIDEAGNRLVDTLELFPDGTTDKSFGWFLSINSDDMVLYAARTWQIFGYFKKIKEGILARCHQ